MASMQDLAHLLRDLEEQLVVCSRCGMCQAVCPLYAETGREADVARGKLSLLDGLSKEIFSDPDGVYERLNRCLLCGSCAANCPSGVKVLEIFMKARAIITEFKGLSPAKRMILRGMLARPELFDGLMEIAAKFQKLGIRPASDVLGTSCARVMSPLIEDRHFRPLAETPFHRQVPTLDTRPGGSGTRVAFFVGCLADKIFPDLARSTLDVLTHHEVGVFMPARQGCCGIPAVSSGDRNTFERLVRYNVALFSQAEFDFLVTSCATCTATIKEVWPMMIPESADIHARVCEIADKTRDIHQFLVDEVGLHDAGGDSPSPRHRVTYHDPCHLKKSLGVAAQPRAVIQASNGCEFVEMTESDWCCGMGGSFNIQHYDLSDSIGTRKRDNIRATGCDVVATGCPACMMQISDMLSKSGERIAVRHPIQLYAESLHLK